MKPDLTTSEAAKCLSILETQAEPLTAIEIARLLGLHGSRETQRRRVRAIVERLRETGSRIVATLQNGYWLTEDDMTWRQYNEDRQVDAKRILAETHARKKQLNERRQLPLFAPPILAAIEV
jgi:chromosome segregation and condensation protein ScpB